MESWSLNVGLKPDPAFELGAINRVLNLILTSLANAAKNLQFTLAQDVLTLAQDVLTLT